MAADGKQKAAACFQQVSAGRMEISEAGLKQVAAWKYRPGLTTPIDNFLNTYWWTPFVKVLPMWLAPNAVTLIGLLSIVIGYAVLVGYYVPDFHEAAPRWTYLFVALTQFFYNTMDAVDGKQARRTGSSSPLGHLFDHGCDSISTTFISLTILASARLGFCPRGIMAILAIQFPFWLAQWEEYHTHTMETTLGGVIGITEGSLTGMGIIAVSGILGPDFWLIDLGVGNMPAWYCGGAACAATPREVAVFAQLIAATFFTVKSFSAVFHGAHDKTMALLQAVPIFLLLGLGFSWCMVPHAHPRLVLFSLGMVFTFLTNKMIIAALSKMDYSVWTGWQLLLPLPALFVISRWKLLPRHEDVLLGAYCCYSTYKMIKYIRNVVEELSQYLGIYVLRLGPRKSE